MGISLERMPNFGRAQGGHIWRDKHGVELAIQCDHEVAAVKMTVIIDGERHVHYLTRDEASELGRSFADVLCDG